jgi:hypothetical protein
VAFSATTPLLVDQSKSGRVKITTKVQALGSARASLKRGATRTLTLSLTSAARKLLKSKHRLTATVSVTLTSSGGHRSGNARLALVYPAGH